MLLQLLKLGGNLHKWDEQNLTGDQKNKAVIKHVLNILCFGFANMQTQDIWTTSYPLFNGLAHLPASWFLLFDSLPSRMLSQLHINVVANLFSFLFYHFLWNCGKMSISMFVFQSRTVSAGFQDLQPRWELEENSECFYLKY